MAGFWKRTKKIALWSAIALAGGAVLLTAVGSILVYKANHYRLPEELLKAPLEPPRAVVKGGASASSEPAVPPAPLKLPKEAEMEDYLRLRLKLDPNLQSVALYLQILEHFREGNIADRVVQLFWDGKARRWQQDPVTPEAAAWLRTQSSILDLLHRFSRAAPLPTLTFEEERACLQAYPRIASPGIDRISMCNLMTIPMAEAGRLRGEGAFPQALQALEDSVLLGEQFLRTRDLFGVLSIQEPLTKALTMARAWAGRPEFPDAELRSLSTTLEGFEREYLTPQWCADLMTENYLLARQNRVNALARPTWRDPIYGWFYQRDDGSTAYPYLYFRNGFKIPHPGSLASHSAIAIRNRLNTADALREFDRQYLEAIALLKESPEKLDAERKKHPLSVFRGEDYLIINNTHVNDGSPYRLAAAMLRPIIEFRAEIETFRGIVAQRGAR